MSHPLDRFPKLDYSTPEEVAVPEKASLKLSRRELSDNASFDFCIVVVVEQ